MSEPARKWTLTPPGAGRFIEPGEWYHQRWGWLETLRGDGSLNPMARLVAHELALGFANARTLRCDPSMAEIAARLASSKDTIRRAIADLERAGWIARQAGNGRGNRSQFGFVTRAQVVPIGAKKGGKSAPLKGSADATLSGSERVADLQPKGGRNAPPQYKPYKNQNHAHVGADTRARPRGPQVSENPMVIKQAAQAVLRYRGGRVGAFDDLKPWVVDHILAAGLLTEAELAASGLAEKGGAA